MIKWIFSLFGYNKSSRREKKLLKDFRNNLRTSQNVSFKYYNTGNVEIHKGIIASVQDSIVNVLTRNESGRVLSLYLVKELIYPDNYFNND